MQAVYRLEDIEVFEEGMFRHVPSGKMFVTCHRLLNQEIGRHRPRISLTNKRLLAKEIMELAHAEPPESSPLIQISNSLAKQVERYKLSDGRPRVAIEQAFLEKYWTENKT